MKLTTSMDFVVRGHNSVEMLGNVIIQPTAFDRVSLEWRDYNGNDGFTEVYDDLPTALLRAAVLVACAEGKHGTAFNQSATTFSAEADDFIRRMIS